MKFSRRTLQFFIELILISLSFSLIFFLLLPSASSGKQNIVDKKNEVTLYLFWGKGCPHCDKEKVFLERLRKTYPELKIKDYEVWHNKENARLSQNDGIKSA